MSGHLIILSQHENPDEQKTALQCGVIERCRKHRLRHRVIPPLYHIAESSELWKELAECVGDAVLLGWLHPRPAHWLLRRHQIVCAERSILNLHGFPDAESAWLAATSAAQDHPRRRTKGKHPAADADSSPHESKAARKTIKPRWYPVIDGFRCVQCQHCLQFCLFGVYALDAEGKVQVRSPDQCKTGCPACARVCPQGAIMFPLYEKDAAIAGAPGQYVILDAAARRMFYARTQQPCPACGRKAAGKSATPAAGDRICAECGRPLPTPKPAKGSARAADRADFDDLDVLVDQLDQAMQRRR